ncbi:MAG TPA: efflux RND transporter periplasmic adaptor subunit, partial [Candidatus Acidoferrum sp.]|nr:efflux RND transporter periplasmic adaptor subunit [Candidatus Acidoferrum sp.]
MKRGANRRAIATFAIAIATAMLAGCGGDKKAADADTADTAPANPTLLVSAAKAEVHPMATDLRLLGKTIATRHVIIRAPTAGRVVGLRLSSGDMVHKGQLVAHVINREVEAAEAGLGVARKIDPRNAPGLTASVDRYNHSRISGIP